MSSFQMSKLAAVIGLGLVSPAHAEVAPGTCGSDDVEFSASPEYLSVQAEVGSLNATNIGQFLNNGEVGTFHHFGGSCTNDGSMPGFAGFQLEMELTDDYAVDISTSVCALFEMETPDDESKSAFNMAAGKLLKELYYENKYELEQEDGLDGIRECAEESGISIPANYSPSGGPVTF